MDRSGAHKAIAGEIESAPSDFKFANLSEDQREASNTKPMNKRDNGTEGEHRLQFKTGILDTNSASDESRKREIPWWKEFENRGS